MSVHSVAKSGFNTANDHYDKARPSYQADALSYIRRAIKAPGLINVAEIGAGTGLFTKALVVHPDWKASFKELKAVEPSPGMREVFSKTLSDERVSIAQGTFEQTGVPDGWADVVVIAQAFHWCPDFDKSSIELGRVLKPGGVLALIWNLEDRETAKWVAQVRDCIEQFEQGTPQYRLGLWRRTFDTTGYQTHFEPPQEQYWAYSLPATQEIVTDRAFSKSYIAILTDEQKTQVRAELAAILEKGDEKVWIDQKEGSFEYPYKTDLVICRRRE
ncbi:S-adenosyl-L-methionine-dependent methyltransferase [Mycena amicta]|nr:S-adenosyl-L-methionine-dependent methyltransferase [Mycena amicta]